jgi:DNA-binding transcriptional LysR family regulator
MIHDFIQLTCFVVVAEELHFGRAAERLCMTQPPLSRQIQILEHSLGVKLFERTSRTVRLTTAGRVFLIDARRLLNLAEQATTTAQRTSRGESGRVIVAFTSLLGLDLIPRLIASAQRELPDIDVVLREMLVINQLKALDSNTIDVGFLWPLTYRLRLKYQMIFRDPLRVVLPFDHPLASRSVIAPSDLEAMPFIMYSSEQSRYLYSLVSGLLVSWGVTPKVIQHLEQVLTVVGTVRAGMGVSIVPALASQFHFDDIVFRPISRKDAIAEARMAWREDNQNPALDTFRHFVSKFFAENFVSKKA